MRDASLRSTPGWTAWGACWAAVMLVMATACLLMACGDDTVLGDAGPAGSDASQLDGTSSPDGPLSESGPDAPATDGTTDGMDAGGPDGHLDVDSADSTDARDAGRDTGSLPFDAGDCGTGSLGEPVDLSCTGLYADWTSKTVSADVVQYDPGLHFWSDGADKTRWIHLPAGKPIDTSDMDEWTFPVGTKIWKEFRLPLGDAGTDTRIETRLLWKLTPTFWYRTTYRWSDDGQTSATELTAGQLDAGGTGYEVPSQMGCDQCHNGRKDGVLGFEAVSLSSPGASGLTIQDLTAQGLLTAPPSAPITIPGNATEVAALAFLHSNCGTACHNTGNGQAGFSGFWMRLDVATLGTVQTTSAVTSGWNQLTSGYSIPGAPTTYRLHACDTTTSAAYYRADHRDGVSGTQPNTQMPPVDTHAVDVADMAVLQAWIDEGCDAGM